MKQVPVPPESLVFVLGCQRSGTTWLANILDASAETLLFMEPFSSPFELFPEFPEAAWYLSSSSPFLDHLLRIEMPGRLIRHKTLLHGRSVTDPACFRLERWLAAIIGKNRRFTPARLQNHVRKFQLLNLNRMDGAAPLVPKLACPHVWIIKELRLAGKIPVLLSAFPAAHFIVIMRHPCATVHSILSWFERGRLGELRKDLETYLEKIEIQTASQTYRSLIASCRDGCLAHTVALYWRISYETMFRQLGKHPLTQFIIYEQLVLQPREVIEQSLRKAGMEWSPSIGEYLSYSTSSTVEAPSAITTVRSSATCYRSWMEQISEMTEQAVLDIVGDSFLMSYFEPYY